MSQINPSPNRTKPPAFEDLEPDNFEELCCALLEKEPQIQKADLFKTKRQLQYGVDVIGELENEKGLIVISCKVRQILKKGNIPAYSNEFLDHWDSYWKDKKVKRFILAVTYPTNSEQREKEVNAEKKRFKKLGLIYETWPKRTLQAKVRPHRGIASQFLGDQVTEQICGLDQPSIAPIHGNQAFIDSAIIQQIEGMQKALSQIINNQLKQAREQINLREGNKADNTLTEIVNDQAKWTALSDETKAAVKRLIASRALHKNDIASAKGICAEAESLDKGKVGPLKALIKYAESGSAQALKLLKTATSPEELRLRAGLHLNMLNAKSALSDLDSLPTNEIDGEALRLYSLAYMMIGDRPKAYSYMMDAEQRNGDWHAVQKTGLIIRLQMSLSPCLPFCPSDWPNPTMPELVLENEDAGRFLNEGLSITERLLKDIKYDKEERKDLEVWRIAFLSNLKSRSLEVESHVEALLEKDRAFAGPIIWSLARGYNFDLGKTKESLKALASSNNAAIEQVLCLVAIYQTEDNDREAKSLLKKTKNQFKTRELKKTWNHWYQKSDVGNNRLPAKNAKINDRLTYHLNLAAQKNDLTELVKIFDASSKKKLHPELVFLICINLAIHGKWKSIYPYSSVLVEKIQTPDAIRLAATSAYNTGNASNTIKIIDDYVGVFPKNSLPVDIRRLRNMAAKREGDLPYALTKGEELVAETKSFEDRLEHANTLLSIGDIRGATPLIRGFLREDKVSSEIALKWSITVHDVDPILSNQLFQKIQIKELPGEFVGTVICHSYKLGLDNDLAELLLKMDGLADQQPQLIQKFTVDDIPKIVEERREKGEKVDEAYTQGNMPIHLVSTFQGVNLSEVILGNFSDLSEKTLPEKNKLLFRYAGRKPNLNLQLKDINLHLDITAILIAFKLGLLDIIGDTFKSINIAPNFPSAMIIAANDLKHHQPARLHSMRKIVSSLENGDLHPTSKQGKNNFYSSEDSKGATVVLHDEDLKDANVQENAKATNIKQVIEGLQKVGLLDKKTTGELEISLPNYMKAPAFGEALNRGDKLIFDYNTLELLVSEGLLGGLCQAFIIYLDETYINDAKAEIKAAEFKESISEEVSQLRELISEKIKTDSYKVFPASHMSMKSSEAEKIRNENEACLYELLSLNKIEDSFIWVDDRLVNRYLNINGNPILDVYDIISLLRDQGIINEDQVYDFLLSLRKANYYFIPVEKEEVIYHLQNSNIESNRVVENKSLAIIRQYTSMLATQENFLNINPQERNTRDELNLILPTYMLAEDTLNLVWSNSSFTLETKQAYSEWIWNFLRIEQLKRVPVLQSTMEGKEHLFVLSLSKLLSHSIELFANSKTNTEKYLDWINSHIFEKALKNNKSFAGKIAKYIGNFLIDFIEEPGKFSSDVQKKHFRLFISELVKRFHDDIQSNILTNKRLAELIYLKRLNLITIQNMDFLAQDFWTKAGLAAQKGKASIRTSDKKNVLELSLSSKKREIPTFRLNNDEKGILSDPIFSFLSSRNSDIKGAFKENKEWFEYPKNEKSKVLQKILSAKNPYKRVRIVELERENSPAYKYSQIESHLTKESSFNRTSLMPVPTQRLIHHLRLRESKSRKVSLKIEKAANSLLLENGPEIAFRYFASFPIHMPKQIVEAFRALKPKALNLSIKKLFNFCHTPLRLFHYISLLRTLKKYPRRLKEFNGAIKRLHDNALELCEASSAVLYYFEDTFSIDKDWLGLAAEEKALVIWYHSEQISNLLISYGMPLKDFPSAFQKTTGSSSHYFLLRDKNYRICPYSPSNINSKMLFYYGLNFALGKKCRSLLSPSEKTSFLKYFQVKEGNNLYADPFILRENSEWQSPVKSFFSEDGYDFGVAIGGEEFSKHLNKKQINDSVKELEVKIRANPNELAHWLQLCIYYNSAQLPDSVRSIFKMAPKIDFYALYKEKTLFTDGTLKFVTSSINLFGDYRLIEKYKTSLLDSLRKLSQECKRPLYLSNTKENDWESNAARALSDSFIILSRRNTLSKSLSVLADTVLKVCTTWPSLSPIWRDVLNLFISDLGFKKATLLWDTQIKLRTMK